MRSVPEVTGKIVRRPLAPCLQNGFLGIFYYLLCNNYVQIWFPKRFSWIVRHKFYSQEKPLLLQQLQSIIYFTFLLSKNNIWFDQASDYKKVAVRFNNKRYSYLVMTINGFESDILKCQLSVTTIKRLSDWQNDREKIGTYWKEDEMGKNNTVVSSVLHCDLCVFGVEKKASCWGGKSCALLAPWYVTQGSHDITSTEIESSPWELGSFESLTTRGLKNQPFFPSRSPATISQ